MESEEDFMHARETIAGVIRVAHRKLNAREYPLKDLTINIMLGKSLGAYEKVTPQHVRAAHLLLEQGARLKARDIISFVKVRGKPNVKPTQLASIEEIDVRKYVEMLRSTVEQILDALGMSFDEIVSHRI